VVAERLHTLVISSILGKPFFGLVYDVKVQELVDYLGMKDHSLNINQPFESSELLNGITRVLDDQKALGEKLKTRSSELRQELTAYFLEVRKIVES
ncbi:MAG: hypothetical protein WCP19_01775, partial [Chloroflexota bacterium]